tara:strand:+ start:21222 stop:21743 length:522 start_codon:yes stop_codon:yes gene_type:complete
MKNLIRKILKEETEDFDWVSEVDTEQDFEDYFYGKGEYYHNRRNAPGIYIARDIKWWKNWIMNVYGAHAVIEEDVEEFAEMVKELVNPIDGGKKEYTILANDVYDYVRSHKGKTTFQESTGDIKDAYDSFGLYANNNNLNILQVMDVFDRWLNKRKKEGRPLHVEDGQSFNID